MPNPRSSTTQVFILHPPEAEARQFLLKNCAPGIDCLFGPELPEQASYQVLVAGRPNSEHLAASPELHTLVIPWAGLPDVTRDLLVDFPKLAVHNLHHNAALTAEMALALLLAAAKRVIPFDQRLRQNDWRLRYESSPSISLHGKTALILGYGQIGQRVGIALQAIGMQVIGVRRHTERRLLPGAPGSVYPSEKLMELLPRAQVLMITAPLTDATEGLIDERALASLPREAVLVNVGRGPVVDQAALFTALQNRRLGAAGLDVWYHYPTTTEQRSDTPPADFPFHELDNVVLSPHRAGLSTETEVLRMQALAELLNALQRGGNVPNAVDLQMGY